LKEQTKIYASMKIKTKSTAPQETPEAARSPADKEKYSTAKRWSAFLAKGGHTPVVNYFLEHYHDLKPFPITSGEAMFVIHLMYFKWGEEAPYPGYKTIAKRMGVSHKTARRHAQELEGKQYLVREKRENQPNKFHLNKLIKALEEHKRANPPRKGDEV
jgi:hypothetical protein